jgi:hypothetical protein
VPVFAAVVLALGAWEFLAPVSSPADLADAGEETLLVVLLTGED